MEQVLTGDIGGTNARFGIAKRNTSGSMDIGDFHKFVNDDYASFDLVLENFLAHTESKPDYAVFAIAGPVANGQVEMTHRNWQLDERILAEKYGFKRVMLINDFAAMARAAPELSDQDCPIIHVGQAVKNAPILVAGPGTGFGMATLIHTQGGWQVISGQGGHQFYAPTSDLEWKVLRLVAKETGYPSVEWITSGKGCQIVHKAICDIFGEIYEKLNPAEIRERAQKGDKICNTVCVLRAEAIMRALSDGALAVGAHGGAVLAGGVSERLIHWLTRPESFACFYQRGPMVEYLQDIPIRLIRSANAPLIGAAALIGI